MITRAASVLAAGSALLAGCASPSSPSPPGAGNRIEPGTEAAAAPPPRPTTAGCTALPDARPPGLVITLAQEATYPTPTGRRHATAALTVKGTPCTGTCWLVEPAKLDTIYADLRRRSFDQLTSHVPAKGELMMHMDERWLDLAWDGGGCKVEDSYQHRIDDADRQRFDDGWDAIGVLFGDEGAVGMR